MTVRFQFPVRQGLDKKVDKMNTAGLDKLRDRIFASDNKACFIERVHILDRIRTETEKLPVSERYAFQFETLLAEVSTPIEKDDMFAGRMVEGIEPDSEKFGGASDGIWSEGHITLPMPEILSVGLKGISEEVKFHAERRNDEESLSYRDNTLRVVKAIQKFSLRYAAAAEQAGKAQLARTLQIVPWEPAYDFFSALQSVWTMQFICSTICGARDYAPGRADQYLLPYYRKDISNGTMNRDQALEFLAFFMMKFNEITGTTTDNFAVKPIPCNSSKQYVALGGRNSGGKSEFNELSELFVEAAELVKMPQPTLNFRISANMPEKDWKLVGRAASSLHSQCNYFNDELLVNKLLNSGIDQADAWNCSFTACNRVDLPGRLYNIMPLIDKFDNTTAWFREALGRAAGQPNGTTKDVISAFKDICSENFTAIDNGADKVYFNSYRFTLDCLFFPRSRQQCRSIYRRGADTYRWQHHMASGIATMGNSLYAVECLVEREKRYSLNQLWEILESDFDGNEALAEELRNKFKKYGNGDQDVDRFAALVADTYIDALEEVGMRDGWLMMPSLYSLTHHHQYGADLGATPDGRRRGEQISENQSPVHGSDNGVPTELLNSVASLPLARCICGGLNVKFVSRLSPDILEAAIKTFFAKGGQHIGISIVERSMLEQARQHPEEYRNLCVRKTGFSEYYVSLSPHEQQEMIDRTEY